MFCPPKNLEDCFFLWFFLISGHPDIKRFEIDEIDEKVGRRSDGPVETSEASVAAETA